MESTSTKNLRHLFDLTHAVPEIAELGAAYTFKLIKTFNTKGLTIPPQASQGSKFCVHCSTVHIPGVNMSMRVVYSKRKKEKKDGKAKSNTWMPRKRTLRLTCFCCNKAADYDIMNPVTPKNTPEFELPKEAFVAKWDPKKNDNEVSKETGNKAKERAKKRKKNSLSSLLSGKKDAEEKEKKKSSLLSLNEFMKM